MNVLAIYCKTCDALFYANAHVLPEDVPDIVAYVQAGHRVALVDNATVRQCLASCHCDDDASTGAQLIADERVRQMAEEGYSAAHDDAHAHGELISVAAAYALFAIAPESFVRTLLWPWQRDQFKPSDDSIHNLARAGALLAAEIDRLLRAQQREQAADEEDEEIPGMCTNCGRMAEVLEAEDGSPVCVCGRCGAEWPCKEDKDA